MLDHQRDHLAVLRPEPVRDVGRPPDPLAGQQRRLLAANARHALTLKADHVGVERCRVFMDGAVGLNSESGDQQAVVLQEHLEVDASATWVRVGYPVWT